MLPLGSDAPSFELKDVVSDQMVSSEEFQGNKPLLVVFLCNHCPYVKHVQDEIARVAKDYDQRMFMVGISSNDASEFPDDAPAKLKEQSLKQGFIFPYLYDESQEVAKKYKASCTPDFFLFNKENKLVYRGQLDDARPGNTNPVTGKDLRTAIEATLEEREVNPDQKPSTECNIKWKKGQEPDYFKSS